MASRWLKLAAVPLVLGTCGPAIHPSAPEAGQVHREVENSVTQPSPAATEAILAAAAAQLGAPRNRLRLVQAQPATWPDSCLGLAAANEKCRSLPVEGWRIVVAYRGQRYAYRTDATGSVQRGEALLGLPPHDENLPLGLAAAVIAQAAADFGLDPTTLQIVQAERRTWADTCLELPVQGRPCIAVAVPGWRVTVTGLETRWAYRLNSEGSLIGRETSP